MTFASFHEFCMGLPGTEETVPFDRTTLVFKVGGKMYALADVETFDSINLKWPPEANLERREEYPGTVNPGYHMSKVHWSTVKLDGRIPDRVLTAWIRESYELVKAGLPKTKRP